MLKARNTDTSQTVAHLGRRLRRFPGKSGADGCSVSSTSRVSPTGGPSPVPLKICCTATARATGESDLGWSSSALHRDAEIGLPFNRDKANRFAENLKGSREASLEKDAPWDEKWLGISSIARSKGLTWVRPAASSRPPPPRPSAEATGFELDLCLRGATAARSDQQVLASLAGDASLREPSAVCGSAPSSRRCAPESGPSDRPRRQDRGRAARPSVLSTHSE